MDSRTGSDVRSTDRSFDIVWAGRTLMRRAEKLLTDRRATIEMLGELEDRT